MRVRELEKEKLKYALGGLLYCPADNQSIVKNILTGKLSHVNTLVLCLEDAIMPQNLEKATDVLEESFKELHKKVSNIKDLPLIFIRVRNPQHLESVYARFHKYSKFISGFVLPKYDTSVMYEYTKIIHKINVVNKFWYLPILESESIITGNRGRELASIRKQLDNEPSILGILVGSNDMCRYFRIRRNVHQNVYQIGAVNNILSDIIKEFVPAYVVNGPVWEFFDSANGSNMWATGLAKEIELDQLNGFIGKACIHPKQVKVVNEMMKVDKYDYEDACDLVNWSIEAGVQKSKNTGRMNEIATNLAWAEKTKLLGDLYGVKENNIEDSWNDYMKRTLELFS